MYKSISTPPIFELNSRVDSLALDGKQSRRRTTLNSKLCRTQYQTTMFPRKSWICEETWLKRHMTLRNVLFYLLFVYLLSALAFLLFLHTQSWIKITLNSKQWRKCQKNIPLSIPRNHSSSQIKQRNLWRTIIAYALMGYGIKNKQLLYLLLLLGIYKQ